MRLVTHIDALGNGASERPWRDGNAYGALVTEGRGANAALGADDREMYGGHVIGETICAADRVFIAELTNAWPVIREVLLAAQAAVDGDDPNFRLVPMRLREAVAAAEAHQQGADDDA